MGQQPAGAAPQVLAIAMELGYINAAQSQEAVDLQKMIAKGKLHISIEQILLQRRFVSPAQFKTLMDELDLRRARETAFDKLTHAQKIAALKFFGKYDIQTLLSEKGYTRVYKARDVSNNRQVVLKILPSNLSKNSQWIERFRREMYLAGNLSHPNLVATYECGSADGSPYIAMEWLDGVSIGYRLEREGNIPEHVTWQIALEAAKGLAFAEARGVVHRDVKPDNLLLTRDGRVKVIDMGLAKSLVVVTQLTAAGESVGTPLYMAPEQAVGKKEIDSRADIYGLGCTIFHMLTGMVPFFAESAVDVMNMHVTAPRPDPREHFPEFSEGTSKLVQRLMAVNPEDRPPTASALVEDIQLLLVWLPQSQESKFFVPKIVHSTASNSGTALPSV